MSIAVTANKTHNATVAVAEAIKQVAYTPTATQATIIAADVAFAKTAVASAIVNGVNPIVFMTILRSLGRGSEGF